MTYSDSQGYFIFDRIIIPKNSGEYCISSYDDMNRQSPIVCLPPLPDTNIKTNVGPIILAPTLSQDTNSLYLIASGQSVPNSTVNIQLFQVEKSPKLIKNAQAFSLPQFTTNTDSKGYFNLNLPTQYSSEYRYYATTITKDLLASAKSNVLWYQNKNQDWYGLLFYFFFITVIIISIILFIKKYKNRTVNHHYLPAIQPHYWPRRLF